MDVGILVALSIAAASEALLKDTANEATRAAYASLKNKVAQWARIEVDALEIAPISKARQAVVAEIIDSQPPDERSQVKQLSEQLIKALREDSGVIGLDITQLRAIEAQLGSITVTEGTGVRIRDATISGNIRLGSITVTGSGNVVNQGSAVGIEPVEPWPEPRKPRR